MPELMIHAFSQVTSEWIAGAILVAVFASFVMERIPPEVTALGGMVAMVLTGILPVEKALAAFSNEAVVMVAAMLVVCMSLARAGVLQRVGSFYERVAGGSQRRGLWVLMLVCGGLSAVLNNTSIVIIFLPIVMSVCRRQAVPASRVLIPLSFATVAGGMVTLVGTSTNLVTAGIAKAEGVTFSMFEIAPLGLAVMAVTLLYLAVASPRLLPDRMALSQLIEETQSREYLTRAFVSEGPALAGRLYAETPLARLRGIRLIDVIRGGALLDVPLGELRLEVGDQLILKGRLEDVMTVRSTDGLALTRDDGALGLEQIKTEKAVLMEAVLGPGSTLLHKSIRQLNFRQRYGVIILAVHRMGVNLRERFEDMRFLMGDTLLLEGPAEQMNQLFRERGFINLTKPKDTRPRRNKAWLAGLIMACVCLAGALAETEVSDGLPDGNPGPVAAAVSGPLQEALAAQGLDAAGEAEVNRAVRPLVERERETMLTRLGFPALGFGLVALAGALLCVFFRCIDMAEVYEAMEWRILLMIVGTVGIGAGLKECGVADTLASGIVRSFQSMGPWVVLSVVYLISVVLTEFLSNAAVAAILTPIAIQTALQLGVDPKPFAVAAMFGSTLAFSTPIGYQTNLLVYNAAGYRFGDFAKIGIPLTILLWILCSVLIPVIWPLTPLR
jgi:di/tricarboxylate transporter